MSDSKAQDSIHAMSVVAEAEESAKIKRRNDQFQSATGSLACKQKPKEEASIQLDTGNSENEITAFHDLIAGGVAGSASVIVGHPFDTLKVRMQTSSAASSASLLAMASTFGGFSSLFRGMAAPLSTAAVVNAIIFSSYGASSRLYDRFVTHSNMTDNLLPQLQHDSWQKATVCGSFAGFVQCIVICPMEHIKCRLQIQHGRGANDYLYKGPMHACREIFRTHGIRGLYRGWWTTALREVPAFGMYFATYDYVKDRVNSFLAAQAGVDHSLDETSAFPQHTHTWIASAFAGGVSGSLTWGIIYPVDVIKSRIQTTPFSTPPEELRFMAVGRAIVAKQGYKALWRGLTVTLLRAFPVNGIIFPVYEFTLMHISNF